MDQAVFFGLGTRLSPLLPDEILARERITSGHETSRALALEPEARKELNCLIWPLPMKDIVVSGD